MAEETCQNNEAEVSVVGLVAEYHEPHHLVDASREVHNAGYQLTDSYTPFPIHGIDQAMGIRPTILPWIVFCVGITGGSLGLYMQYWMNAVDYPYLISGKPLFGIPANIPVTFEITILTSAITTLFGMLLLNRLPKYSNPLFRVKNFYRATNDRFFIFIDANDKLYDNE
ncbi:MAG: DUF3341 domain-containing protein, partial [Pirellulaceae bacterium]|nr:DUF3341 domain-containing protein [Pirellulaceae bacterium]